MICSAVINNELSKEDFIKAMHTHKANFAAPLRYDVPSDSCGCQPAIYDAGETVKANNYFIDSIVMNGIRSYSEDNNKHIVALAKHDVYTRPPILAEAKIHFQRMSGILKQGEIDRYKWEKGSEAEGILIKDVDGKIFDYPLNYRWIKSVFSTAVVLISSLENMDIIIKSLFENVHSLAENVRLDKSNNTFNSIMGDYKLFAVGPEFVTSCPLSESELQTGCTSYLGINNNLKLVDTTKTLKGGIIDSYHNILKDELMAYDKRVNEGNIALSWPKYFGIDKKIN
jgi:hypothetical protein